MTDDTDAEQKIMRSTYEAVLDGRKPSGLFSRKWDVTQQDLQRAQQRGLEVRFAGTAIGGSVNETKDTVIIARPQKFKTLFSEDARERFRTLGLGDRVDKLREEISDRSIGETLEFLHQYPRVDEEYDLTERNLERPEVAALTGISLGYPTCDVEYCLKVWYFDEQESPAARSDPIDGHGLCPACSERLTAGEKSAT